MLAAQQVRIHTSTGSKLLLSVGSNPIIEHCSGMAFGPLLPAQRAALGLPALVADRDSNRYASVQDFNWLRSTPSPNWYALMLAHPDVASTPLFVMHGSELIQLAEAPQKPDFPSPVLHI